MPDEAREAKTKKTKMRIRNDRYNVSRPEFTLIRVGRYLWAMHKGKREKTENVTEGQAIWKGLEQVWELKRELRAELKAQRAAKADL